MIRRVFQCLRIDVYDRYSTIPAVLIKSIQYYNDVHGLDCHREDSVRQRRNRDKFFWISERV